MRPFCNKGWPYLSKFESILPQSGAKGRHAYCMPLHPQILPLSSGKTPPARNARIVLAAKTGKLNC